MTGRGRLRPAPRVVVQVVAGLLLATAPLWPARAGAQTEPFLGFTLLADADALTQTGGDPSSQGYPQVQSRTAHTETRLDTGPNGRALASIQWPGELVGNAGSLAQVFGAPEEAAAANYPVRAEATSSGPTTAESPGASAAAEGPTTRAVSTVEEFDGAGSDFLSFGEATVVSESLVEGVVAISRSRSEVRDISIGGGAITIDSVTTVAGASTDGTKGTRSGETVVSGLEVGGQPARVDENGVHFAGETNPNPISAAGQVLVDQVLSNLEDGMRVEMFVSQPRSRDEGGLQEYQSGALVMMFEVGDPGGSGGGTGLLVIGGANAFVQATPAIAVEAPPAPVSSGGGLPSLPPTGTGTVEPPPTSTAAEDPSSATPTTVPVELAAEPAAFGHFGGLAFVMPFFVLLGSLLAGHGLHRWHAAVVHHPRTACDLEGDRS